MPAAASRRLALLLAAAAAAGALAAAGAPTRAADDDAGSDGGTSPSDLRTVTGKVASLAWEQKKITVEGPDGAITLDVDRNTTVFLDNRLGSLRDVVPGAPVRAEYGPKRLAFWIEVRSRNATGAAAGRGDGGAADGGAGDGGADAGMVQIPAPPAEPDAGAPARDGVAADGGARDAGTGSVLEPGTDGGTPPQPAQPGGGESSPPAGVPPTGGPTGPSTPQPPVGPGPVPGGPIRR